MPPFRTPFNIVKNEDFDSSHHTYRNINNAIIYAIIINFDMNCKLYRMVAVMLYVM